MKKIIILSLFFVIISCSNKKHIIMKGKAVNAKAGAMLICKTKCYYVSCLSYWNDDLLNKRIKVRCDSVFVIKQNNPNIPSQSIPEKDLIIVTHFRKKNTFKWLDLIKD